MKIKPLQLMGTATLGLASFISAASALDDNKQKAPEQQQQVQVNPFDIPKLIEKKLPVPDHAIDGLLGLYYLQMAGILKELPEETNVKIAKMIFNDVNKTLKGDISDLRIKEGRLGNFLEAASSSSLLKGILLKSKGEYQDLIGAYLDALSDKENKREKTSEESASWNAWSLREVLIKRRVEVYTPKGLFSEKWYPKIEKITARIENEFKSDSGIGSGARKWAIYSICALAELESKKDSDIKEPKLHKTLFAFVDKGYIGLTEVTSCLSDEVQVEGVKRVFNRAKKMLIENAPNLQAEEHSLEKFLNNLNSKGKLKDVLAGSKNEYQELIGAYIHTLADKGNKRKDTPEESASWNAWTLETNLLTHYMKMNDIPAGLFSEKWYEDIDKVIERINKEFTPDSEHEVRKWAINAVSALSVLELRSDSGIKEPRIYHKLVDLVGDISDSSDIQRILKAIPDEGKLKAARKVLLEAKHTLLNNKADLPKKESSALAFVYALSTENSLTNILLKNKNEYQDLVSAYINVLSNPEKNIRASNLENSTGLNARALLQLVRFNMSESAPFIVFNKNWNLDIEKIIEQLDKTLKAPSQSKAQLIETIRELGILEFRKESNIKEPKIYSSLINLVERNPKLHFFSLANSLETLLVKEAILNDSPQEKRLLEGSISSPSRIKANEALIQPYEKTIQKILNALPRDNASAPEVGFYNTVWDAAARLAQSPFYRPGCVLTYYDSKLEKIKESELESIPALLTQFQDEFSLDASRLEIHKEVGELYKKHLEKHVDIGFKYLLDENPTKNELGSRLVIALREAYSKFQPFNIGVDANLRKSTSLVFNNFQKQELKNEKALRAYFDFFEDVFNQDVQKDETLKCFAGGLHAQVQFASKVKQAAANAQELLQISNREVELLKGANQLMEYADKIDLSLQKRIEFIEPFFKAVSQDTLKNAFRDEILQEGTILLKQVAYFPTSSKDEDKECRRFFKESLMSYLNSLLEGSKNLSSSSKDSFQKEIYDGLSSFFRAGSVDEIDYGNLFILDETLQSMSKNFFNAKDENKLKRFMHLPNTIFGRNRLWAPHMTVKMLNLQGDYLNAAIKESNAFLDSPKAIVQLEALDNLTSYRRFLGFIQTDLESDMAKHVCTKDEREKVNDFIKSHLGEVNGMLIDKFGKAKVITERVSGSIEHIINEDVFKISAKSIEDFILQNPSLKKKFVEIVDERLKLETEPRTRGMLYLTRTKLNYDKTLMADTAPRVQAMRPLAVIKASPDKNLILRHFRKAIVTETSPITMQYIGQELGSMILKEFNKAQIEELKRTLQNYQLPFTEENVEKLSNTLKEFSSKVQEVIKTGEAKKYEGAPTWNFILEMINVSKGRNIESLLKDTLDSDLVKRLELRKEGEEVDPAILKAVHRILNNSNSLLAGFVKSTNYDELQSHTHQWLYYYDRDKEGKASGNLFEIHKSITDLLEHNLQSNLPVENIPYVSAALFGIYNSDVGFDLNKKITELGEKLFIGTKEKLSIYEDLQVSLYSRYIWKHIENCRADRRNNKEDLAFIEAACIVHRGKIESATLVKGLKARKETWNDISFQISKLDPKLYSEMVAVPLNNFKVRFLEKFILLAPHRQRQGYAAIALDRCGLRSQISEVNLRKVLLQGEE